MRNELRLFWRSLCNHPGPPWAIAFTLIFAAAVVQAGNRSPLMWIMAAIYSTFMWSATLCTAWGDRHWRGED